MAPAEAKKKGFLDGLLSGFSFNTGSSDEGLKPRKGDVQFTDVDGDVITLCPFPGTNKVTMYVNSKLQISQATLECEGNLLKLTGKVKRNTGFLGFELEDIVTMGSEPADPSVIDAAMALVKPRTKPPPK